MRPACKRCGHGIKWLPALLLFCAVSSGLSTVTIEGVLHVQFISLLAQGTAPHGVIRNIQLPNGTLIELLGASSNKTVDGGLLVSGGTKQPAGPRSTHSMPCHTCRGQGVGPRHLECCQAHTDCQRSWRYCTVPGSVQVRPCCCSAVAAMHHTHAFLPCCSAHSEYVGATSGESGFKGFQTGFGGDPHDSGCSISFIACSGQEWWTSHRSLML
jgi:hypothetical protein